MQWFQIIFDKFLVHYRVVQIILIKIILTKKFQPLRTRIENSLNAHNMQMKRTERRTDMQCVFSHKTGAL